MTGALAALLTLATALADDSRVPPATSERAAEVRAAWSDLASPWHEVRRDAERRLRHLPAEDAREIVAVLAASDSPSLRRAFAEWARFRFERPGAAPVSDFERALVVERLAAESDPAVREALVHAAARDEEAVRRVRAARDDGRLEPAVHGRVVDARIVLLLEDVMHEGRVPGFYDGQFSALFALDDSVYRRLLATALDPRVTYVARALSVMALHEARRPTLEAELQPLFVSPTVEFEFPDQIFFRSRIETEDVLIYCACKLSQYARFSCAKAGLSRPIDAKIRTLEAIAVRRLRSAEGLRPAITARTEGPGGDDGAADDLERAYMYRLNEAMDTFFELGYHHQQLDDYVRAELEYRKITERPEAVRGKSWAYYNLACIRAIQGRTEEAIAEMGRAVDSGFTDVSWARRDGDLASVRTDPRFHAILRRAEGG